MKEQWKKFDSDAKLLVNVEEGRAQPIKIELPWSAITDNDDGCCKRLLIYLRVIILLVLLIILGWFAAALYTQYYPRNVEYINQQPLFNKDTFKNKDYESNDIDGTTVIQDVSDNEISKKSSDEENPDINGESVKDIPTDFIGIDSVNSNEDESKNVNFLDSTIQSMDAIVEQIRSYNDRMKTIHQLLQESKNLFSEEESKEKNEESNLPILGDVDENAGEYNPSMFKEEQEASVIEVLRGILDAQREFSIQEEETTTPLIEIPEEPTIDEAEEFPSSQQFLEEIKSDDFIETLFGDIVSSLKAIESVASESESQEEQKTIENLETEENKDSDEDLVDYIIKHALNIAENESGSDEEKEPQIEEDPESIDSDDDVLMEYLIDPVIPINQNYEDLFEDSQSNVKIENDSESRNIPDSVIPTDEVVDEVTEKSEEDGNVNDPTLDELNNAEGSQEPKISEDFNNEENINSSSLEEISHFEGSIIINSPDSESEHISGVQPDGSIRITIANSNNEILSKLVEYEKKIQSDILLAFIANKLQALAGKNHELLVWYYQHRNDPNFLDSEDKLSVHAAKLLYDSNLDEFSVDATIVASILNEKLKQTDVNDDSTDYNSYTSNEIMNRLLFKAQLNYYFLLRVVDRKEISHVIELDNMAMMPSNIKLELPKVDDETSYVSGKIVDPVVPFDPFLDNSEKANEQRQRIMSSYWNKLHSSEKGTNDEISNSDEEKTAKSYENNEEQTDQSHDNNEEQTDQSQNISEEQTEQSHDISEEQTEQSQNISEEQTEQSQNISEEQTEQSQNISEEQTEQSQNISEEQSQNIEEEQSQNIEEEQTEQLHNIAYEEQIEQSDEITDDEQIVQSDEITDEEQMEESHEMQEEQTEPQDLHEIDEDQAQPELFDEQPKSQERKSIGKSLSEMIADEFGHEETEYKPEATVKQEESGFSSYENDYDIDY